IHLHVDGAWAGSALILPEVRALAEGLEHADSFVFNPHKWLFTNFDCSVLYLKDPKTLARALSLTPAYLESVPMGESPDYRDLTVSLGRRFRALKLWFVLRSYGAEGLREKIRGHIAFTGKLAQMIEADPDFELVSGPRLALLGFRFLPKGVSDPAEIDRANEDLVARINDDGRTYLTKTRANGRTVIRFVIGQTHTEWRHV
ncbi:MAG: aspartate aminotransferase family protein, partial [Calditrichaeota bacterium]|nr:aspartate aminotransferase family protein [Calditrichota bacterium]